MAFDEILGIDLEKPDAINEKGIKFWLDKKTTDYAKEKDLHGRSLKNIQVMFVQFPSGKMARLITENGEPIYEDGTLEGIGMKIDIMKAMQSKGCKK